MNIRFEVAIATIVRAVALAAVAWLPALVLCASPARAVAAIPGAENARAYSTATYARDLLPFNRATLAGAYVKVGKTDPRWDEEATTFLDAMAVRYTSMLTSSLTRLPERGRSHAELLAKGEMLVEQGCDDPLVAYCLGSLLVEVGNTERANRMFATAAPAMMASRYPTFRKLRVVDRWLRSIRNSAERPADAKQFCIDALSEFAASPECAGAGRRLLLTTWADAMATVDVEQHAGIVERMLANPKSEKWFAQVAAGEHRVEAAWRSRGVGWARDVTEDGWAGFREHLAEAAVHLKAAHAIDPSLPEAATRMIAVAMGGGPELAEGSVRDWFDRAVAAQVDHANAYSHLSNALLPRWGGSHRQMLELASECAQAGRYDTDLPYRFQDVFNAVAKDDVNAVLTPAVYEVAAPVFDEMAKRADDQEWARYHRTYKLALETRLGDYDAARKTLDAMDGRPTTGTLLPLFGLTPVRAVGKVMALTGAQGTELRSIEADERAGRRAGEMLERLRATAAALTASEPKALGTWYANNWVDAVGFRDAYAAGDWVTVTPTKDWFGWDQSIGQWTVNADGSVTAVALAEPGPRAGANWFTGPLATFTRPLGERFAVRATLSGDAWFGGMLVAGIPPEHCIGAWFGVRGETVEVGNAAQRVKPKITVADRHDLMIEVWDGTVTVSVDGQRAVADHAFEAYVDSRLSLNGLQARKGRDIVYQNVQVKRLTQRP